MDPEVDQGSAPRQLLDPEPAPETGNPAAPVPGAAPEVDVADGAGLHLPFQRDGRFGEAVGEVDHQVAPRHFGGGVHALRLRHRHRHRLLAQHVQPLLEGGDRQRRVKLVRHGDADRIEPGIGEHVGGVGVALVHPQLIPHHAQLFFVDVAQRRQLGAGVGLKAEGVALSHAHADHPHPQLRHPQLPLFEKSCIEVLVPPARPLGPPLPARCPHRTSPAETAVIRRRRAAGSRAAAAGAPRPRRTRAAASGSS